jgi:hypothetical protein
VRQPFGLKHRLQAAEPETAVRSRLSVTQGQLDLETGLCRCEWHCCSSALIRSALQFVYTCPATMHVRLLDVVHRSAVIRTSPGVSRLLVYMRLVHVNARWRVLAPDQSAHAGALPRRPAGTANVHRPDARRTPPCAEDEDRRSADCVSSGALIGRGMVGGNKFYTVPMQGRVTLSRSPARRTCTGLELH